MTSVTVYSAGPACPQCKQTLAHLQRRAVAYTEVDVRVEPAALEYVTELGYTQAPIVVVDDEPENHWYGFRPDLIDRLLGGAGA